MIVTGRQIKAARALIGMRAADLARAAGLHRNAVGYWERRRTIPRPRYLGGGLDVGEPFAVEAIRRALGAAGVETFADPSPGVRLAPRVIGARKCASRTLEAA